MKKKKNMKENTVIDENAIAIFHTCAQTVMFKLSDFYSQQMLKKNLKQTNSSTRYTESEHE